MKERPIPLKSPMVRAILEGRKTITRRAMKVQPVLDGRMWRFNGAGWGESVRAVPVMIGHGLAAKCPLGRVGDRLWVREGWQDVHPVQVADGRYSQSSTAGIPGPPGVSYRTIYRADGEYPQVYHTHNHPYRVLQPDPEHGSTWAAECGYTGWMPSVYMPRSASRLLLEVTAVRIERLQEITRSDIRAEGLECPPELGSDDISPNYRDWYPAAFRALWESGGGDWEGNPWVWVVEFKRVLPESAPAGVSA